ADIPVHRFSASEQLHFSRRDRDLPPPPWSSHQGSLPDLPYVLRQGLPTPLRPTHSSRPQIGVRASGLRCTSCRRSTSRLVACARSGHGAGLLYLPSPFALRAVFIQPGGTVYKTKLSPVFLC